MNRSTADLVLRVQEAQATADDALATANAAHAEVARLRAMVRAFEHRLAALETIVTEPVPCSSAATISDPLTWPRDGDGREVES